MLYCKTRNKLVKTQHLVVQKTCSLEGHQQRSILHDKVNFSWKNFIWGDKIKSILTNIRIAYQTKLLRL